jgi:tetratricopeptide (TPR) repeat protein
MFCQKCGKESRDNAKFCVECGKSFNVNNSPVINLDQQNYSLSDKKPRFWNAIAISVAVAILIVVGLIVVWILLVVDFNVDVKVEPEIKENISANEPLSKNEINNQFINRQVVDNKEDNFKIIDGIQTNNEIEAFTSQIRSFSEVGFYDENISESTIQQYTTKQIQAIDEVKLLLDKYPNNAKVQWQAGELYRIGHNLRIPDSQKNAEQYLQKSIELDKDFINPVISLGWVYLSEPDVINPVAAEKLFRQAVGLSVGPNAKFLEHSYDGLIRSLDAQNKFEEGLAITNEALVKFPNKTLFVDWKNFLEERI